MPGDLTSDERDPGRGWFLVLDGPDGGGKTTQAARLAAWLRAQGRAVVSCKDPGGTALGDRLQSLLLDRGPIDFGIRAEMLLFMASRAQLVEEIVRPALAAGKDVVSDRFLLANIVYQGHAGGLSPEEVGAVGRAAIGGLLPDLTILLDLDHGSARGRLDADDKPFDRLEAEKADFHARVRQAFLDLAAAEPERFLVLDASLPADDLAAAVRARVAAVL